MIEPAMLSGTELRADQATMVEEYWPSAPGSIAETELPIEFLLTHALKTFLISGPATVRDLSDHLGAGLSLTEEITAALKADQSIEAVDSRGYSDWGIRYRLTAKGVKAAEAAMERSRYAGVLPVTLHEYSEMAVRQSLRRNPPSQAAMDEAFAPFVLRDEVKENLALTFHSGRPLLIFGASGNGKTSIVESYARTFTSAVLFPQALFVSGQVIHTFDPVKHVPLPIQEPDRDPQRPASLLRSGYSSSDIDRRWIKIRRPVIFVGGELEPSDLDLTYDAVSRQYQAPAHMKAQDGIFMIDDFGRQRARPEDILNRWIVPMESGTDNLTLLTGEVITIPFEMALTFSSNLALSDLADEAFLRRIPYKICLPAPDPELLAEIARVWCQRLEVAFTEAEIDYLCQKLFGDPSIVPSATQPRDIAKIIVNYAHFKGVSPVLAPEFVDKACSIYFVKEGKSLSAPRR